MRKNRLDFHGQTILVIGSTRGIGHRTADLFARLGGNVIYTGTGARPNFSLGRNRYLSLDLAKPASLKHFFRELNNFSQIDVLVNNAGINIIESISDLGLKNWNKILEVNLTGAARLLKVVSARMMARGQGGKILNVSSIFGVVSRAQRNSYSASKAGLIGLTRASALDLAPHGILVNAICPGFTKTDLTMSILSAQEIKQLVAQIPAGRMATEDEIARTAIFLCSPLNTYMTGQMVIIDGGYTIR